MLVSNMKNVIWNINFYAFAIAFLLKEMLSTSDFKYK